jgi:hypothetical protein
MQHDFNAKTQKRKRRKENLPGRFFTIRDCISSFASLHLRAFALKFASHDD